MANTSKLAYGTLLKIGDGASPEVFTAIANIASLSGPNITVNQIEVPVHNSGTGYIDKIAGLKDAGEISMDLNYDPNSTTHTNLFSKMNSGSVDNYKVEIAASSPAKTFTFAGIVTEMSHEFPVDGVATCSVTISISGAVTLA